MKVTGQLLTSLAPSMAVTEPGTASTRRWISASRALRLAVSTTEASGATIVKVMPCRASAMKLDSGAAPPGPSLIPSRTWVMPSCLSSAATVPSWA